MSVETTKDAKIISKIVLECLNFYSTKKKIHYHNAYDYDEESNIHHIYFCPSKKEIVGGSKDGKKSFFGFMFHIDMFLDICKSRKIHIINVAFSTKTKSLECESLIFTMIFRNKQYALKIFGKPAKDVNFVTKINCTDKKKE